MANWNEPVLGSAYADFLNLLKERDEDAARAFDGVGTNVPENTLRWNNSQSRFERLQSGNWQPRLLAVSGGGTGAATALDARANLGLTKSQSADASTIVERDSAGRAKVNAPFASNDIARKAETDAVQGNLDTHVGSQAASTHGATSAATANRLVSRDSSGRARFSAPSHADDAARKAETDALASSLSDAESAISGVAGDLNNHEADTSPHSATAGNTANRLVLRNSNGIFSIGSATAGAHALNRDTGDNRYAFKGGDSGQNFSVGSAGANAHAVSRQFGDGRYVRPNTGSNVVNQNMLGSNSVGQSQLKTGTGTVSLSTSSNSESFTENLPGGIYGFYPTTNAGASQVTSFAADVSSDIYTTNWNRHFTCIRPGGGTVRQRYIQSSPPYDHGDGPVHGYIYILIDDSADIWGSYAAEDPAWYGMEVFSPIDLYEEKDKVYGTIVKPLYTVEDLEQGRVSIEEFASRCEECHREEIEITTEVKMRGMNEIPHPFHDVGEKHVVLLDPMSEVTRALLSLMKQGQDIHKLIEKRFITIDNSRMTKRKGPPRVSIHSPRWKKT